MNPALITQFRCPTRDQLHDWDYEAEDCCPPSVEKVSMWRCDCGETYDDQDHARLCCWDGESELAPYQPTPQELEAAGQQRLSL